MSLQDRVAVAELIAYVGVADAGSAPDRCPAGRGTGRVESAVRRQIRARPGEVLDPLPERFDLPLLLLDRL